MSILTWESVDTDNFSVFIRDLGETTTTNLKHMIQDAENASKPVVKPKKNSKPKKKDLIIAENNQRLHQKKVASDQQTMTYAFETIDNKEPYTAFAKLQTQEAKTEYKIQLLKHYWQKKYRKKYLCHVINLFYHLQDCECNREHRDFLNTVSGVLQKYEIKGYMLEKMGHLLPPLNFWDSQRTLDEWQLNVVERIKHKESVLVRAPTSAGKTFVAMATGVIHDRVLYVCPAKPVVYQVGAAFVKMGYRVHYLVENHSHLSYDKSTNIFVGVPTAIEECLPKIGVSFSYAVFDEIHTLNDYDSGICYENIVRLLSCSFLALSATIQNIQFLKNIFDRNLDTPLTYIEYQHRFINQQRWVYNDAKDTLKHLHPLLCYDGIGSIKDIAMTPHDMASLYQRLVEAFDNTDNDTVDDIIERLDPEEYFTENTILTLDTTKRYECDLKQGLDDLFNIDKDTIQRVRKSYETPLSTNETLSDIVPFLKKCRKKDLLPMLYFHTREDTVKEIFLKVYESLQTQEVEAYPFHYKILEKKDELYREYMNKREVFVSNLKIKSSDSQNDRQEAIDKFDRSQKNHFVSSVAYYYDWCVKQCAKQPEHLRGRQVKNLLQAKESFIGCPDFRGQDIFQKHPDYCFTRGEPMSGQEIRAIKREIKATASITIEYEHPLFQLLKRGIGVYLDTLPDEYNRVVQRLLSHKRLGIVLSDRTLCLGIDLPIRSVAFSGYKDPQYSVSDYLQMSGRAGRRGHDNQGNIIFHNVKDCYRLMKGTLPLLKGSMKPVYSSYNVLEELSRNQISVKPLYSSRYNTEAQPLLPSDISLPDDRFMKVAWLLRYYKGGEEFATSLIKLEKKVFLETEDKREAFVLNHINTHLFGILPLDALKMNRIDEDVGETLIQIKKLGDVCKHLVNTLNPRTYKLTTDACRKIFDKCKTLIYKYRLS